MIYRVFKQNSKTLNMVKHNDFETLEQAEKSANALRKKSKRRKVNVIEIPEHVGVGYVIYRPNGEEYGTIVKETKHFYYVDPAWKKIEDEFQRPFFLKDNFQDKFEKGTFKAVDGDPNIVQQYEEEEEESEEEIDEEE